MEIHAWTLLLLLLSFVLFHLFIHFFSTGFFLPAIWPVLSFCSPFSCQRSGQFGVVWGFLASDLASSFVLACHFLASGWLVSFLSSWCLVSFYYDRKNMVNKLLWLKLLNYYYYYRDYRDYYRDYRNLEIIWIMMNNLPPYLFL